MDKGSFHVFHLNETIIKAIDSLGYTMPTEIQAKVIPEALAKNDLVVRSQTGSGKTAAYAIPICELIDWLENKPQALILTPTRELAVQVKEDITDIGRLKRMKATALYGRQPFSIQKTDLKQKTHVVVGTPGRVLDHIEKGTLVLSRISFLVIDEADEMLNMGFIEQVEAIIKELPVDRMTMLFSATLPEPIKNLALKFMKQPIQIEMEAQSIAVDKIDHFQVKVQEENKIQMLKDITVMENPDSCIIFCKTKERVDQIFDALIDLEYPCEKIHGGMEQDERLKAMNKFKRGIVRYFVATDVAARGIDIDSISLIINYDIPLTKESYVHRTGRTGRAGKQGRAITFVSTREEHLLEQIETYIGFLIPEMELPTEEEIEANKQAFLLKLYRKPEIKSAKGDQLNKDIMTLRFNAGKKRKLRATNFVGVIANLEGVTAEDIGIITITDSLTFIDILNGKGPIVLNAMQHTMIGGKQLKVSKFNK